MNEDQIVGSIIGGSIILAVIFAIIVIALIVFYLIGLSKLFKKAGKPGWAAIVPFYSTYVLVEIAGLKWWWFLIAIAGTVVTTSDSNSGLEVIVNLGSAVADFFIFYNLAKKFKQNPVTFGILGAFFAPIISMILGFSEKYEYDASVPVSPNGPIDEKTASVAANTEPEKFCLGCGKKLKPGVQFCENCGKKVE